MNLQTFTVEGLNEFRQDELRAAAKKVNADRVTLCASVCRGSIRARVAGFLSTRTSMRAQPACEAATSVSR